MLPIKTTQTSNGTFFNHLLDFSCKEITIGGNFNLVLDAEEDKKGGLARTHKKSVDVINIFVKA